VLYNINAILKTNNIVHTTSCQFLARDVIYTSRTYATMSVSVCLSVCVWRKCIGAFRLINLGFKFRSHFTAHCGRRAAHQLAGRSSRATIASARLSCLLSYAVLFLLSKHLLYVWFQSRKVKTSGLFIVHFVLCE